MPSLKETYLQMTRRSFFNNTTERICLEEALEEIEKQVLISEPTITFIQLPPGYGKTAIPYSLSLWAISSEDVHLERSIHVLPLRSIVENSWERFKRGLEGLGISDAEKIGGAQCMFVHGSPFLQKNLAITTLDTFSLLMAKLPPAEIRKIACSKFLHRYESLGHYEVGRGALFSSVVVFDEVHLFIGEGKRGHTKPLTALLSLILVLLRWRVPVVVMTATLPSSWMEWLVRWFKNREQRLSVKSLAYSKEGFMDENFEKEVSSTKIRSELLSCGDDVYVRKVMEAAESYERVLVIANTIDRARRLYEKLRERGLNPLLLHSKFSQGDRKRKVEVIGNRKGRWLCVSTQVVEAGVDISSQVLFTDIAPPCSLVQRAGRCCRPPCEKAEEGKLAVCVSNEAFSEAQKVYDDDLLKRSKEALEGLSESFNWHSYFSYMPLLEKVYGGFKELDERVEHDLFNKMLKLLLHPYWESYDALWLLLKLGSFTRDEPLITGLICEDVEGVDHVENFIPLEFSDVSKIARRYKIELIARDGKRELKDVNREWLYEMILRGDVLAVRVPLELYDSERGLLI